jgi:streptogramin lyase
MRSLLLLLALASIPACTMADPELLAGEAPAELGTEAIEIDIVGPFPSAIHGMALTETGRLYFTDSFGTMATKRSLYFIDPPYTGPATATLISGTIPAGLMLDGSNLYLCDVARGTVRRIDQNLRVRQQWSGVLQPWNITRLPDGTLLTVSNAGVVQRLNPDNTVTTLFGGLDAPFGIASAGDGTVWISEQGVTAPGKVTRRSLTGAVLESIEYAWNNPEGLFADSAGNLWIAETGLGQILRYDGTLTVEGEGLGLPVVITGTTGPSMLANSANGPAQLISIDIVP